MSKTIRDWQREVHVLACEKGWWPSKSGNRPFTDEPDRSALEAHMLILSEVAEATEEARKGTPPIYQLGPREMRVLKVKPFEAKVEHTFVTDLAAFDPKAKTEGEAIELADAVIRIMDYFEYKGWDLEEAIALKHAYNKGREYRHGGKKY